MNATIASAKDIHDERPVRTYSGFVALAIGIVLLLLAGWLVSDMVANVRARVPNSLATLALTIVLGLAALLVVMGLYERRAAMLSNLLTVLCAESEVQPVVNTGTLYA